MKKIKLNKMSKLYDDYMKIKENTRICGVDHDGIQLNDEAFLELFETYDIQRKSLRSVPYYLSTYYNGVKFFCLVSYGTALKLFPEEPTQYIQDREEFFI